MSWKVVERNIGKAGSYKRRIAKQKEWDRKYGDGNWTIGYFIDGEFVSQDDAIESVYYKSYENHFENHPKDLEELINTAKKLNNPHAQATTGVDLQTPAIINYLEKNNLKLKGSEMVDIGSWQGKSSHKISIRLSPLHIKCAINPKITLEKFWQKKKCLVIWEDDE